MAKETKQKQGKSKNVKQEAARVYTPFFQVKIGGVVVDHTNSLDSAKATVKMPGAKPTEIWRIHANGHADLIERVSM